MENYLAINKKSWNDRLESHLDSDFYDLPGFLKGKSSLNKIELDLLGNVQGKKILHLQCHFGQDTISLSRMGAEATGIDLSDLSIDKAQSLATNLGMNTKFICCDIYDLEKYLNEKFDIVFTSYGTISWLPDLDKWASIISFFLKPGGQFVFAEFHPLVWAWDDDFKEIKYYYNNVEPIAEEETGTYADKNADIKNSFVCWNHGIGEVVNCLLKKGLQIEDLQEYNYAPYPFVNNTVQIAENKFQIKKFGDKLPLVYSIKAIKK
jgi:SAM-dependent methyltransferase